MIDRQGRVWFAARGRNAQQSRLLQGGLVASVGEGVPGAEHQSPGIDDRPEDDEVHLHRHLLRHAPSSVRLRRQRNALDVSGGGTGWSAGSTPSCMEETGDAVRAQGWTAWCSTPTVTACAANTPSPTSRSIRTRIGASRPVFYAVMPNPADGSIWGTYPRQSGSGRARRPRIQSVRDRADRGLQRADAGLRPARRRHRQPGRRLGVARERPPRRVRPAQVQRSAQRAEGDRRPLPRRLVVLPVPGPGLPRHRREQRRVRAITAGSTSTTRSASAATCRCRPPT